MKTCCFQSTVLSFKKSIVLVGLMGALVPLASCANTPFAERFERSLAADPQLSDNPNPFEPASPSPSTPPTDVASPGDRPNASGNSSDNSSEATNPTPNSSNISASDSSSFDGQSSSSDGINATNPLPQPGDPDFIGPLPLSGATPQPTSSATPTDAASPQTFSDLNQAPEELRPYIQDLAQLGVLTAQANATNQATQEFKPNAIVTRREYARWLVAANNAIYRDRPAQKIRLGVSSDEPIFRDVPRTDPDFAAIQGLAEAGLIPSSLSGDATITTFRPDAPLTRESLILWKAPVDVRQTLPNATVQAIQETWGFQDANRIEPSALRAVLADFQNGDLSNIRRAFGYTTLFQPKKTVTRAEAASVLWYFGSQGDGISAKDALN